MKKSILFPVLLLFGFLLVNKASAYTTLNGDLSGQTLTAGTYLVSTCTVNEGTTLQIQAGAILKFSGSYDFLRIDGTLNVSGTETNNVWFTSKNDDSIGEIITGSTGSPQSDDWRGIAIYNGVGEFEYCQLRYGGSSLNANLTYNSSTGWFRHSVSQHSKYGLKVISNSNVEVFHGTFEFNYYNGILSYDSELQIDYGVFNDNGDYAFFAYDMTITQYTNCTFSQNGINAIGIRGNVSSDMTWISNASSPYVLIGVVNIDDGVVCTIPAGSVFKADTDGQFYVRGTLDVNGTSGNPVVFTSLQEDNYGGDTNNDGTATSAAAGDWKGIIVSGYGGIDGIGEFDNCIIKYGGGGYESNIYFTNTNSSYFTNSVCEHSLHHGLKASSSDVQISGSAFSSNAEYAAYLQDVITVRNYPNNSAYYNGIDAFGLSGTVTENTTWTSSLTSAITSLIGTVTVNDDIVCTIPEGTIIKANNNGQFSVSGTLDVNGTEANPVIFTSLQDDTYGGDTNNDGTATSPAPGDWKGLYLYGYGGDDGIGEFDHCRIRYGGNSSGSADANVNFTYSDSGHFINSICEYSLQDGLKISNSPVVISNSGFENNGDDGIYASSGEIQIDNCQFNNNGTNGIYASSSELQIDNCQFNNNGDYAAYLISLPNIKAYANNSGSGNFIEAFGISGTVSENLTLDKSVTGFPFVLIGTLDVNNGYTLTIPEGEVIKSTGAGYFNIEGTLDVNGTETDPVIFTSFQDDTYGGDLNNDGSATLPAPGDWQGIKLFGFLGNDGIGEFDYCRIRYGGNYNGEVEANVYFVYSNSGHFINSICEYSLQDGLKTNNSTILVSNSSFENNTNNGINASSGELQIDDCQFNNNGDYAAYLSNVDVKTYTNNSGSGNFIEAFGISGTVSENLTLSESVTGFPFVLIGTLDVNIGNTLTIPEGEVIKVKASYELFVEGTLDVNGTVADPVIFTSFQDDTYGGDLNNDGSATLPAPGDWQGIKLFGFSGNDGIGEFDYCRIRYGGNYNGEVEANVYFVYSNSGHFINSICEYSLQDGLKTNNSTILVSNSSFENNTNNGINASSGEIQIDNCQFNNNGDYAAYLISLPNIKTYANNSGSGNFIEAFGISGTVSENLTLDKSVTGFPFVIIGTVTVNDEYTITIPEGEVVKFTGTGYFDIQGTLDVNGTETDPVIFTSFQDDTYGGDLNNDGSATLPAPGDWRGLYLYGYSIRDGIGEFDHCRIRYGGNSSGSADANVNFAYSDSGHFTNSICEYSLQDGLKISNSPVVIFNSLFQNNNSYGIYISGTPVPDLGQNNLTEAGLNVFINNDGGNYQLYNTSTLDIDAYYNDWGYYTEAEIDAHIYDDNENAAYGEVLFNPWFDPTNPPIEANFVADTLSGRAPFTVQFSDLTLLEATSWQWDFDNDGTIDATEQNPNWDFMQEGIYSVKLTASNGINDNILVRQDFINVNGAQTSHALQFDGLDDFVKTGGIPFPSGDHTIEAWIYPTALNSVQEIVFFYDDFGGVQFRIQSDSSLLYGESVNGNWDYVLSTSKSFEINTWTHVAVTKQGDNCNLFVNGINVGFNQFDNNPAPDTMSIGARSKYMDRFFEGDIDEVRIWTVARTQSEIRADMTNYLNGDEAGLYVYYRNNEGLGQKTYDLSRNSFHGRLGLTSGNDTSDPVWVSTNWPYEVSFKLDLKAFLQGPFDVSEMKIDLNNAGLIPANQPYNVAPWNYYGTEAFVGTYDTTTIVDWVLVDFRDAVDAASAIAGTSFEKQAAFILNDGQVVGTDGSSILRFNNFVNDNLFVAMSHRNHIGVLSANPVQNTGVFFNYDFTTSMDQAYGTDAQTELGNNIFGMIGGDANANGTVDTDDKTIWAGQAGNFGYYSGDFTMDGQVHNVDKNEVWTSVGIPTIQLPTLTTTGISDISQTTASGGGNVTKNGGAAVTARGICWGLNSNPTLANGFTTDGNGTGSFASYLTGLSPETEYFVRAYATNSEGTAYGNEVSFTTLPILYPPIVITASITDIAQTTATGGGNVTDDGGAAITAQGICWSLSSNPDLSDSFTNDGSGLGSFVSSLSGLNPDTEYFVRAYATNSEGTAYGNEVSFYYP